MLSRFPKAQPGKNPVKEKIYDNCLTALHLKGFEIEPLQTNKQSGLIVTKKVKFNPVKDFDLLAAEYYLNMLVFETAEGKPSINININGVRWYEVDKAAWGYKKENVQNQVNNRFSDDLTNLFQQLEITIGKDYFTINQNCLSLIDPWHYLFSCSDISYFHQFHLLI